MRDIGGDFCEAMAAVAVLAGTLVEGTVVGTAQWSVLRVPLPRMSWRTWAGATSAGAFLAWLLGMIPSTVLSLGADSGGAGAAPAEPSNTVVLALAFLMGLVLGPVLGFAQWLVLRRFVSHAALWMPANAFAWAFGMVVIFTGVDPAISGGFGSLSVAILALTFGLRRGGGRGDTRARARVVAAIPMMSSATRTRCLSGGVKKRRADLPHSGLPIYLIYWIALPPWAGHLGRTG
jgi:hypothetical protein